MAAIATRLRLPAQVQDTLLAVFVAWFQIEGTHLVQVDQQARPLAEPAYLGYLLLIVSGLVLLVRRRWPVAVFATVVAVSLVYYAAGYPDGPGWVGLFVATYTLTAHGDGHRSLQLGRGRHRCAHRGLAAHGRPGAAQRRRVGVLPDRHLHHGGGGW